MGTTILTANEYGEMMNEKMSFLVPLFFKCPGIIAGGNTCAGSDFQFLTVFQRKEEPHHLVRERISTTLRR